MGVWGSGLYSGDFAMDLRNVVRAVARLPFDGDKLVDLVCETEPTAARNPDHEDHTTFWLVVADQFAKIGIVCERAREKALQIIDSGRDIAMLAKLGMKPPDLNKRMKMLVALQHFLTTTPQSAQPRSVLKIPQALRMGVGDVFVYPTSLGRCKQYYPRTVHVVPPWTQDGWSAAVIVSAERAFDFLAWYRPVTLASPLGEKPGLAQLRATPLWVLKSPGTCSAADLKRLGLEKIGALSVDSEKLKRSFPSLPSGVHAAVMDRSIEQELNVGGWFPETFIFEAALRRTPEGLTKLPDLIREATGRQETWRALHENAQSVSGQRNLTLTSLDDILSGTA